METLGELIPQGLARVSVGSSPLKIFQTLIQVSIDNGIKFQPLLTSTPYQAGNCVSRDADTLKKSVPQQQKPMLISIHSNRLDVLYRAFLMGELCEACAPPSGGREFSRQVDELILQGRAANMRSRLPVNLPDFRELG